MCGVAGIVGDNRPRIAEVAVREMISTLVRRGPDDKGLECWNGAVLGHRRLSIFDLSNAGRQPVLAADRSVGVVFNGAIYNYQELRKELIAQGCQFKSNTDTEVLVHGYREWGIKRLISRLRGMFAFGLWDDQIKKLYLIRDRLGVKPLVFAVRGRTLAFASTVGALRAAGYVGDFDEQALAEFLKFGFIPDQCCVYRNVVKVPAGSIIEWENGVLKSAERYWRPPSPSQSPRLSFAEVVEETERLFLEAVECRLNADVPVAALLSGGIDSALVCWAIAKLGRNITAYTIATPGDPWDESQAASDTARRVGIQHRVLTIPPDDHTELLDLVSAYSEPFACASALGMLRLSRTVSTMGKVLLTGDGGDDVFLGYLRHRHLWLAGKIEKLAPQSALNGWLKFRGIFPRKGPLRRAAALLDYAAGDLTAFFGNRKGLTGDGGALVGERLLNTCLNFGHRASADKSASPLERFLDYEQKTRFVGEYLTKVDGTTMYYGLEARSPFLDQELWEFTSALPIATRLHHGEVKAILRTLARRRIGWPVASRRKRGFGIPVQRWMTGTWLSSVEESFRDSMLVREGWISGDTLLSQFAAAVKNGYASQELWYIFVLESWMRRQKHGTEPSEMRDLTHVVSGVA